MVVKLIIEGTADTKNGDLRKGFNKLLGKKLNSRMPRIIMGDGKSQAIDKFRNSDDSLLLCDLDGPENIRAKEIIAHELETESNSVFFMIQEMEAWFISQPEILEKFYHLNLKGKIPQKPAIEFANPAEQLQKWTHGVQKKGEYHKVKHGATLLEMLDADRLMRDFVDFKTLINKLVESQ